MLAQVLHHCKTLFHLPSCDQSSQLITFQNWNESQRTVCQIEACLISRPLVTLLNDDDSFKPLTPGHSLIGRPLGYPHSDRPITTWHLCQELILLAAVILRVPCHTAETPQVASPHPEFYNCMTLWYYVSMGWFPCASQLQNPCWSWWICVCGYGEVEFGNLHMPGDQNCALWTMNTFIYFLQHCLTLLVPHVVAHFAQLSRWQLCAHLVMVDTFVEISLERQKLNESAHGSS